MFVVWGGAAPALAQPTYDRIVAADDISFAPIVAGGWQITARALLANQTSSSLDLSCTLTIAINGAVIGSVSAFHILPPGTAGPCTNSCGTDPGCIACRPSPGSTTGCFCCTQQVQCPPVTVAALNPGDVISAVVTAAPRSATEQITTDDTAFQVVPPHTRYNRILPAASVRYQRSPVSTGPGFLISGVVGIQATYPDSGDVSCDILVSIGTVPIGGGHGGHGGCGSTDLITYGPGLHLGGYPTIFTCAIFCQNCSGSDVNVCDPPGYTSYPLCSCIQFCTSRVVPGHHWEVEIPQLDAEAFVTIGLAPLPGSLPELDESDDQVTVRVRDITLCSADFDGDGDIGTDADIEAFFACLSGSCCRHCGSVDFNRDGDIGTDLDIESFFTVLAGGRC